MDGQTERQTDGNAIGSTALPMRALWRGVQKKEETRRKNPTGQKYNVRICYAGRPKLGAYNTKKSLKMTPKPS